MPLSNSAFQGKKIYFYKKKKELKYLKYFKGKLHKIAKMNIYSNKRCKILKQPNIEIHSVYKKRPY